MDSRKIKNRIFLAFFLLNLVGIFMPSTSLRATSLSGPIELQDLAKDSQWICLAKVKKIRSFYKDFTDQENKPLFEKENKVIYSEVTFTNLKNYKGELDLEFSVIRVGGCVSDRCLTISEQPELRAGDQMVLFLHQPGDAGLQPVDEILGLQFIQDNILPYFNISLDELENQLRGGDNL